MTSTRVPPGRLRSIGALPKSKSGPRSFGQFSFPGRQLTRNASAVVAWFHQWAHPLQVGQVEEQVTVLGYPASFSNPETQTVVSTNGTVSSTNVAAEPDPSLEKMIR